MRGGIGAVAGLTVGYAHDPLRVATSDGAQRLSVVSDQAFADFGFAATYERLRLYLSFDVPLVIGGESGAVGGYSFTASTLDPGSHPDTMSDARIGFDARLVGDAASAFRLGAGVQLYIPNGTRADYDTDGSYRAMGRLLFAGDVGAFTYAAHLGAHVRPLDDSPTPGSPRGSELLFGAAGGVRWSDVWRGAALVVGPEIYGASSFRSLFATNETALEGLLTGRIEGTADDGAQLRFRAGAGAGLDPHFGAPTFRLVFGIEVFDRRCGHPEAR
jgi:hypothetical protein